MYSCYNVHTVNNNTMGQMAFMIAEMPEVHAGTIYIYYAINIYSVSIFALNSWWSRRDHGLSHIIFPYLDQGGQWK